MAAILPRGQFSKQSYFSAYIQVKTKEQSVSMQIYFQNINRQTSINKTKQNNSKLLCAILFEGFPGALKNSQKVFVAQVFLLSSLFPVNIGVSVMSPS